VSVCVCVLERPTNEISTHVQLLNSRCEGADTVLVQFCLVCFGGLLCQVTTLLLCMVLEPPRLPSVCGGNKQRNQGMASRCTVLSTQASRCTVLSTKEGIKMHCPAHQGVKMHCPVHQARHQDALSCPPRHKMHCPVHQARHQDAVLSTKQGIKMHCPVHQHQASMML